MTNSPHADHARERAERTEAEQAELYRTPKARMNNAFLTLCSMAIFVGTGVIAFMLIWFVDGWRGVIVAVVGWLAINAILGAVVGWLRR